MLDLNNPVVEYAIVCSVCKLDQWHCRGFQCDNCGRFTHEWRRIGDMCICETCFKCEKCMWRILND
jgi:hypothetical protein